MHRFLFALAAILGMLKALLLARLVLRMLAARPENPVFAALFALTGPLCAPLTPLDAGQPRFGAVLELSTLATCICIAVAILILASIGRRNPERKLV